MEHSKLLHALKAELEQIRANGQGTVNIEALQKYIDAGLSPDRTNNNLEHIKLEQQRSLAQLDVKTRHDIELFKSVIEAGLEALKALILINGGAVIALLGFLGATISKGFPPELGLHLTPSILAFGSGVLAGAIGSGLRYATQFCYGYNWVKSGHAFNIFSILSAVGGYVLFAYGIFTAYKAFATQFSPI